MAMTSADYGYASLISQGIANTISAFGSIGVTKHNNAIAQSQANIARLNAQIMERQAQGTLRAAEKAIVSKTMQAGQFKSSQRARLAANGISVGVGSAAEMQASTDIIKEIDTNQIKSNAVADAWGSRMKATQFQGEALMKEASKKSVGLTFGSTLLAGASQVANNYMLMSAHGVFDKNTGVKQSDTLFPGLNVKDGAHSSIFSGNTGLVPIGTAPIDQNLQKILLSGGY